MTARCLPTQSVELRADRRKALCEDPDVVAKALDKDLGVSAIGGDTFPELCAQFVAEALDKDLGVSAIGGDTFPEFCAQFVT